MKINDILGHFVHTARYIVFKIWKPIVFSIFFIKYRLKNSHNLTTPVNMFDLKKVNIWRYTYGYMELHMFGDKWEFLEIWDYCSIATGVVFILWGNHDYRNLSTYPMGIRNSIPWAKEKESYSNWKVEICDDVWIWTWAKIMSWVTIWQWAIVAAGALVTNSVPPYAIVGWVPAKIIKYRFPEDVIKKLVKIDYKKIPIKKLLDNYDLITGKTFDVDKVCDLFCAK